uniref:Uncharacterized protein n=1 Tax=Anabas testudineus TaxID=64144 RepID=A0A3Q1H6S0_ANATE
MDQIIASLKKCFFPARHIYLFTNTQTRRERSCGSKPGQDSVLSGWMCTYTHMCICRDVRHRVCAEMLHEHFLRRSLCHMDQKTVEP